MSPFQNLFVLWPGGPDRAEQIATGEPQRVLRHIVAIERLVEQCVQVVKAAIDLGHELAQRLDALQGAHGDAIKKVRVDVFGGKFLLAHDNSKR